MEQKIPKVGVGVIVRREGRILLGKRKGSHGENTWAPPGGHLEFMESVEECARRETLEETGIELGNIDVHVFTNDLFEDENKHYITLFAVGDWKFGDSQVLEPEKCEIWDWFDWNELPEPLFLPITNLKKTDFNPFG